jgi:thiamine kinase-like enzyme
MTQQRTSSHGSLWSQADPALLDLACFAAHLGTVQERHAIRTGSSHAVWRVRTSRGLFAVRVGSGDGASQDWQKNKCFAHLRIATGYLNEGLLSLGKRTYRYSVSEWLDGRPFDYRRDLRRLAASLATLHRQTRGQRLAPTDAADIATYLGTRLPRYQRRGASKGAIEEQLRRAAVAALASLDTDHEEDRDLSCLVHNDLVARNILIVSDRARLIDWDWALNAHPALDLCGFLSPFVTSWDKERALSVRVTAIFLNAYLAHFNRADARAIRLSLGYAWSAYNVMAANWLYFESPVLRPQFRSAAFYQRAFARVAQTGAWLRKSVDE